MLFIDGACARPYDTATLSRQPMGGSEASLVRVVRALGGCTVMQHNRDMPMDSRAAAYRPLDWSRLPASGPIVVFRNPVYAVQAARLRPEARVYLWLEDLGDLQLALGMWRFAKAGITLIAVSNYHREQVLATARALAPDMPLPRIEVIYNPIDDELAPDGTPVDPDRLAFISSPHKGLEETLAAFSSLRQRHPSLTLRIANPGYHPTPQLEMAGVQVLGALPHPQVMAALRGAFCLFYPNINYPETFGIVYAEANAIGVPVLAHPFGAAPEVVSSPEQLVDCRQPDNIIERFEAWRAGARPTVTAKPEFRLSRIVEDWRRVADGSF